MQTLEHDDYLALREGARVLERDLHGDKVLQLADGSYLKLFRRKRLISSAVWYPYALRFADNAAALQARGIPVPEVIAVFHMPGVARDAVHYRPLPGVTLRELARNGLDPQATERLRAAFTQFVVHLHDNGVYFRSLHAGNVVISPDGRLGLIDFTDLRLFRSPLGRALRERNLRRMLAIPGEAGWVDRDTVLDARPSVWRHAASPLLMGIRCAWALLSSALSGRLSLRGGHLPSPGHVVAMDYVGVGIAGSPDPAVDGYIIDRLGELGIRHVRIDFTHGDADGPAARLLDALAAQGFRIMLHLVQPFDSARRMPSAEAEAEWRQFVAATLDRFGGRIDTVEVGATVNRRRWSGHSLRGFLSMWDIAHREVRARRLRLAGPNVTDFEPLYNIALLALLESRRQLPDLHTNNLFSERCTEPERYDHRVFGRLPGALLRFNLVHKARLLQRIGADHGVSSLCSPTSFWTLPRIARFLPDSEEKQADYLTRSFVLTAASGAVGHSYWGPLICHREGLIDDGASVYPSRERVVHYAGLTGEIGDFRPRPAFQALRAFNRLIPACRYAGRLNAGQSLEVHAFASDRQLVHVAWTVNGRAAVLGDMYSDADIKAAEILSRDGCRLASVPTLLTESPLYLCWPPDRPVGVRREAGVLADAVIHRHASGTSLFFFRDDGWQGMLCAADDEKAALLLRELHPNRIGQPVRETALRLARNAIWTIADPRDRHARLVVKQPVKMLAHKKLLDRFKPSKALRSWNGTAELLRRGIRAAPPVAYFESIGDTSLTRNYYICEHVAADLSVRELFSSFAPGNARPAGIGEEDAYRQLSAFLLTLHGRGIYYRDMSGGNVLVSKAEDGTLRFTLIDTGRIHASDKPLPLNKRLSDLARLCHKLHWSGRARFMELYLSGLNRRFGWHHRMPFILYDMKARLKRSSFRKWLRRLLTRR